MLAPNSVVENPRHEPSGSGQRIGFWLGVACFLITLVAGSPFDDLSLAGWRTLGLACLMASWWMFECAPLPVTSFLPLAVAPALGLASMDAVAASYANPLIFLFLGGFMLSLAIEGVGLHRRIARSVIVAAGSNPRKQVGGLMLVTALLSMWISNTATAVIMLPIATSMLVASRSGEGKGSSRYSVALLLGIAYSASIGGMATLVGTPPNALLAAYLQSNFGIEIGFGQWMLFGVPFSAALLVCAWGLLTWRGLGEGRNTAEASRAVRAQLEEMGPMGAGERRVLAIFLCTTVAWIARGLVVKATGIEITDAGIAMSAAIALFLIPAGDGTGERLLTWRHTTRLPWGVLLLFGGGLALALLMKASGLADFIGGRFARLDGIDIVWIVAIVSFVVVFLTEMTSNTATAATLLPLVGAVAVSLGESPAALAIPAAVAASCAFMMPVATPPNAIVFASSELKVSDMARAGFALNLVSVALLTAAAAWLIPVLFG